MANYQICDLEEFMQTVDEVESHEQYHQPTVKETIKMPDDYIITTSKFNATNVAKEGEISQLLRITPGIIQPMHCFPKSYIPPTLPNQPDVILNDKIPILLHEKYFKFHTDEPQNHQNVDNKMNNFDTLTTDNRKIEKSKSVTTVNNLTDCFSTVFCDSDEDNSNVDHQNDNTPKVKNKDCRPEQKYYNAREIYQKKRASKH